MTFVEVNKLFGENERLKKEAARLAAEVSRLRGENELLWELANARDVADLIAWRDSERAS